MSITKYRKQIVINYKLKYHETNMAVNYGPHLYSKSLNHQFDISIDHIGMESVGVGFIPISLLLRENHLSPLAY